MRNLSCSSQLLGMPQELVETLERARAVEPVLHALVEGPLERDPAAPSAPSWIRPITQKRGMFPCSQRWW
jgi:hypothetical protein